MTVLCGQVLWEFSRDSIGFATVYKCMVDGITPHMFASRRKGCNPILSLQRDAMQSVVNYNHVGFS